MKKSIVLLGIIVCSCVLVGCGTKKTAQNNPRPSDTHITTKTVVKTDKADDVQGEEKQQPVVLLDEVDRLALGVLMPSGTKEVDYGEILVGYSSAVQEKNDAGGIQGKQLYLITKSVDCVSEEFLSNRYDFGEDSVVPVLGGVCPSTLSGRIMNEYLTAQGVQNIGLIYAGTNYATTYADVVRRGFKGALLVETKFSSQEEDFSSIVKDLVSKGNQLDAIVVIPDTEQSVVAFMQAVEAAGATATLNPKILGNELFISPAAITAVGDSLNGIKSVRAVGLDTYSTTLFTKTIESLEQSLSTGGTAINNVSLTVDESLTDQPVPFEIVHIKDKQVVPY